MRPSYLAAAALGRIPDEDDTDGSGLETWQAVLADLPAPRDDDEARVLAAALPDEAAYGLEWTVVHLLEQTPGWPRQDVLDAVLSGGLRDVLRARAGG